MYFYVLFNVTFHFLLISIHCTWFKKNGYNWQSFCIFLFDHCENYLPFIFFSISVKNTLEQENTLSKVFFFFFTDTLSKFKSYFHEFFLISKIINFLWLIRKHNKEVKLKNIYFILSNLKKYILFFEARQS